MSMNFIDDPVLGPGALVPLRLNPAMLPYLPSPAVGQVWRGKVSHQRFTIEIVSVDDDYVEFAEGSSTFERLIEHFEFISGPNSERVEPTVGSRWMCREGHVYEVEGPFKDGLWVTCDTRLLPAVDWFESDFADLLPLPPKEPAEPVANADSIQQHDEYGSLRICGIKYCLQELLYWPTRIEAALVLSKQDYDGLENIRVGQTFSYKGVEWVIGQREVRTQRDSWNVIAHIVAVPVASGQCDIPTMFRNLRAFHEHWERELRRCECGAPVLDVVMGHELCFRQVGFWDYLIGISSHNARIGNLAMANPPRAVLQMGQRRGPAYEAWKVKLAGLVERREFLRMEQCQ